MLSAPPLEETLYATLAALCRTERTALGPATALLDLQADSLTLIAVVARIEATYGVPLDAAFAALGESRTLGELHALLARCLDAALGAQIHTNSPDS